MVGYKYRASMWLYTVMWAGVYFMQKTSYNNHYYLLVLVCLMMCFLPAHRYASADARLNPEIKKLTMPSWCSWVMIVMVSIVYFYATLAKFYPGWLNGTFARQLLTRSVANEGLKTIMTQSWFYMFIAYSGIAFDLFVVPLLLFKRTRTIAFVASLIFHIFNSITLQIGIFPFFALSFAVFFFPPEKIRSIFFRNKPAVLHDGVSKEGVNTLKYFFIPFLIIQLVLPLRHYFIEGDVLWTEEGHRLSWRMMLRSRNGGTRFKVVDKSTNNELFYNPFSDLTPKQEAAMGTRPDMIWQMAQHIKRKFETNQQDVAVYAITNVSVNEGPYKMLIDKNVDLAAVPWDYYGHCPWILLYDSEENPVN